MYIWATEGSEMYIWRYIGVRNVYSGLQRGQKCILGATEGSEMYIWGYRGVGNKY